MGLGIRCGKGSLELEIGDGGGESGKRGEKIG
jgi:hypothetical protein